MKIILGVLISCLVASTAAAQNKPVFHSIAAASLLTSKYKTSASIQSVNGVAYHSWFAGIGVGYDFYQYHSVPIFLDLRKEFGKQKNKPFLYLDGGLNIYADDKLGDKFTNGAYFDGGAGYAIQFSKTNALLLSVGYSYKGFSKTEAYTDGKTVDYYNFNRYAIKAGLRF